jgi:hypothetical protein
MFQSNRCAIWCNVASAAIVAALLTVILSWSTASARTEPVRLIPESFTELADAVGGRCGGSGGRQHSNRKDRPRRGPGVSPFLAGAI